MIEIMESIKHDIENSYDYKCGYAKGRADVWEDVENIIKGMTNPLATMEIIIKELKKNTKTCGDCIRYGDLHSSCDRARYLEANADDKACENYKESKYANKRQQIKTNLELIREGKHKALNDFMRNASEEIIEELMSEVPCDRCIAHEYCESLDYFCGTCQEIFGSWLQQSVVVEEEQNE